MSTRIIQVNQTKEFWELFEENRFYEQSQQRYGRIANIKEGDTVFIFLTDKGIPEGEIRYKCRVSLTNEKINNGEDTCARLEIVEIIGRGTCTYNDLKDKGFVKSSNFHWNRLPGLDEYMAEKDKSAEETQTGKPEKKSSKNKNKKEGKKDKMKKEEKNEKKGDKKKEDKKKELKDKKDKKKAAKKDGKKKKDNKKKDAKKKGKKKK